LNLQLQRQRCSGLERFSKQNIFFYFQNALGYVLIALLILTTLAL
jgi:hypothetical protein